MKCPQLKTDVTRKDDDFYFLRDKLLKLYPSTMVRFIIFYIIFFNNRYRPYLRDQYLTIVIQKKQIILK